MGRLLYFLIQLGGCLLQLIPVSVLLFTSFSDEHLRTSKRTTVFSAVGIMTASAFFLALLFTSLCEHPRYSKEAIQWIQIGGFFLVWAIGTLLYVLCFRSGVQCRMLGYFVSMQYAISSYTIGEITEKMGNERNMEPFDLPSLGAYGICLLILFPIVWQFLKHYGCFQIREENHWMLQLISGSSVALFFLYVIALLAGLDLFQDTDDVSTKLYLGIWLICMLITDLAAYFIFYFCLHSEEEKKILHVKLTAYELQSQSLNDKIQEDKRTAHNMRHHFRFLVSMMEKHQYQDAEEYLKKYLNEWEIHRSRMICQNPGLNTILGYYITQAEQENIRVITDIQTKAYYPFDMMDLTVLLGNAMENALEACRQCGSGDPVIRIEIVQRLQMLLIRIANSCRDQQLTKNPNTDLPYSSKRGRMSGYGIQSMKMIAEKYQGSLTYEKNSQVFTLQILLNIPKELGKSAP